MTDTSRMTRGSPVPETVTLHVPFRVVRRGGRKEMVLPEGAAQARKPDNTLVKALARAFRWKRMLESGEFTTVAALAERAGIALSYTARFLLLTLLAPDMVETTLDRQRRPEVTLARVLVPFPSNWGGQASKLLNGVPMADRSHRRAPPQLIYDELLLRACELRCLHPAPLLFQPGKRREKPQP